MAILSLKRRTKLRSALGANTRWGINLNNSTAGVAIHAGGQAPNTTNVIDYFFIPTLGNATDFGDLNNSVFRLANGSCGSATRALFAGGSTNTGAPLTTLLNVIDYVTIASVGNATDFGDLSVAKNRMGSFSSSTRGVFAGGENNSDNQSAIEYVTIASTGNVTNFGSLPNGIRGIAGVASPVRGMVGGGVFSGTYRDTISYVTIATTGNSTNFGTLTVARGDVGGLSNNVRGLWFGGISAPSGTPVNTIDYVTIASTGNATDFGDLINSPTSWTPPGVYDMVGTANSTRGVIMAGSDGSGTNIIQYVTIASTGNATDFGDLTTTGQAGGASSSAHGGILPVFSIAAAQAFFASGSGPVATIETVDISSLGDTVYFGELTQSRVHTAAAASSTRAVWAGGASTDYNIIDYITMATNGNATDFGDLRAAGGLMGGCSSSTRAIFAGGSQNPGASDYITIASTGNSLYFGDLSTNRYITTGAVASTTRGVWGGGADSSSGASQNVIDYVTIASTGNATDFGDLTVTRYSNSGSGSSTRGLFSSGYLSASDTNSNVIDYITIASTGNATDFGDLTTTKRYVGGTSSSTRALVAAGGVSGSDDIEYVTISSTGNSAFFGNLSNARYSPTGTSNAHGGL